jgi:anti-sigma B factor antagonist
MELQQRTAGGVVIVSVRGDITLNKGGHTALRDKIRSLVQQEHRQIVVDLGGVKHVDSAGLGELVSAYATTKNQAGSLKLVGLTTRLKDLLTITKLATVFESYDTEAAAIASFSVSV